MPISAAQFPGAMRGQLVYACTFQSMREYMIGEAPKNLRKLRTPLIDAAASIWEQSGTVSALRQG